MRGRDDIAFLTGNVTLADLKNHLIGNGWYQAVNRNKWVIYRLQDESDMELLLPSSDNFADAKARIADAVTALSQIEGKTLRDMSLELQRTNRDSLRIRLEVDEDAVSIPLNHAPHHIQGIRNLFLYSACSEVKVERHFEAPLTMASHFIEECEFGHTFKGSFGFVVSTKLLNPNETADVFNRPFSRRSIERIVRGFQSLKKAVSEDDPDFLVDSYEVGFNARMCDAINDIALHGEVFFDCEVSWASNTPPPEDLASFRTVHIGSSEVSVLAYAAEHLKAVEGRSEEIIGKVVNLHCARNPSDDTSKPVIAIKTRHPTYGLIEVRMRLGSNRYLKAVEAHTNGKEVRVRGVLERKGNTWLINGITNFEPIGLESKE